MMRRLYELLEPTIRKVKRWMNQHVIDPIYRGLDRLKQYQAVQGFIKVMRYVLIFPVLFEMIGRLKYKNQRRLWGMIFLVPWTLGFLLFFLIPFFQSLLYSFSDVETSSQGVKLTSVGLKHYIDMFTKNAYNGMPYWEVLLRSIGDMLINLPVIIIFSLLIAIVLNTNFRGRAFARAVFFIPVIFNSTAIATAMGGSQALKDFLEQSGLGFGGTFNFEQYLLQLNLGTGFINFLVGSVDRISDIITQSGVQILIFLAGIQSIPSHLYEAAKIEGATQYEIFWKITLPMVSPMLIPVTVYTIVNSYLSTTWASAIESAYNNIQFGYSSALSWVYFLSIALLLATILGILSKVVFYYDK